MSPYYDLLFGDRKMVMCVECGKRLGFLEGYYHPTLGKKILLCSSCFMKVDESVTQWREFIVSNSFNSKSPKSISNSVHRPLIKRFAGVCSWSNAIG